MSGHIFFGDDPKVIHLLDIASSALDVRYPQENTVEHFRTNLSEVRVRVASACWRADRDPKNVCILSMKKTIDDGAHQAFICR